MNSGEEVRDMGRVAVGYWLSAVGKACLDVGLEWLTADS